MLSFLRTWSHWFFWKIFLVASKMAVVHFWLSVKHHMVLHFGHSVQSNIILTVPIQKIYDWKLKFCCWHYWPFVVLPPQAKLWLSLDSVIVSNDLHLSSHFSSNYYYIPYAVVFIIASKRICKKKGTKYHSLLFFYNVIGAMLW